MTSMIRINISPLTLRDPSKHTAQPEPLLDDANPKQPPDARRLRGTKSGADLPVEGVAPEGAPSAIVPLTPEQQAIIQQLFTEAFAAGFSKLRAFHPTYERPTSGSAASVVVNAAVNLAFFAKVDSNPSLVAEAANLRAIQDRPDLPDGFKTCFPRVFAVRADGPTYGYLMEAFTDHVSLDSVIFSDGADTWTVQKFARQALDLLFSAYDRSRVAFITPNLTSLYIDRTRERLRAAAREDQTFASLLDRTIRVNGSEYEHATYYLDLIADHVAAWTPGFATFIHGDPHPENILVNEKDFPVDVKFIDPKEWHVGDYLWDIGKILHYLAVTGPIEHSSPHVAARIGIGPDTLDYELPRSQLADTLIGMTRDIVAAKAGRPDFDDKHWQKRLDLSIAANLLSVPLVRLAKARKLKDARHRDTAFMLYGEGLKALASLVNSL